MTTIDATAPALTGTAMATRPAGSMDQNDFLRLMTTQLTTQDPFNPLDNTQMVAQMAQFSQVAGIAEINQSLKALVERTASDRLSDAASWIGRSVLVEGGVASPLADGSYAGEIALPADADEVTLTLIDAKGAVVHRQDFGSRPAGALPFTWDGRDASGDLASNGPLKMVVTASAGGEALPAAVASWTGVSAIQSPASGGASRLVTGLGLISPDAAIRLS
jgi:flagellar basal-body rod modification protein FlgD